jgi:glycosyltransferase involved in cell wall biosynthesis
VVGNEIPSRSGTGLRMRLYHTVKALTEFGTVDLFAAFDPAWRDAQPVPAELPVRRARLLPLPQGRSPGEITPLPSELTMRRYDLARSELDRWATERYDLVWLSRVESFLSCGPPAAPSVLDLDDIEHRKVLGRWRAEHRRPYPPSGYSRLGTRSALSDAGRWRQLQIAAARRVDVAVVCSERDAARVPPVRPVVVPNGYELLPALATQAAGDRHPTITLPGFLRYPPNADAADLLVRRVMPHVRRLVPDVRVRLVGESDARVRRLHNPPLVTVTGAVPDIRTELGAADLIAVPLRYGGGTRIKILEAFAHRLPVVSTSIGTAGLGAQDGVHLMIRDSPRAFAAACVRLLHDHAFRTHLADSGHALFLQRYQWPDIRRQVTQLAAAVSDSRRPAPRDYFVDSVSPADYPSAARPPATL